MAIHTSRFQTSARAALQQQVDAFYEMFVKSVAEGRGVSQAAVRGRIRPGTHGAGCGCGEAEGWWTAWRRWTRRSRAWADRRRRRGWAAAARRRSSPPARIDDSLDPENDDNECECACGSCMLGSCERMHDGSLRRSGLRGRRMPDAGSKPQAKAALNRRRRELDLH